MVGNAGGGSQTGHAKERKLALAYNGRGATGSKRASGFESSAMVETRIKPYKQQAAEEERRAEQTRAFQRNQVFGVLILVAVIVIWTLFHTNPKWIFPPGWWRP